MREEDSIRGIADRWFRSASEFANRKSSRSVAMKCGACVPEQKLQLNAASGHNHHALLPCRCTAREMRN